MDDTQNPPAQDDTISAEELAKLRADHDRLKDLAARAQADLQNAKIRMEREAGDMRKFALEGLVMQLLPTVDNFQRAFSHLPADIVANDWVKGVQAVEQDLIRILAGVGLKKIESLNAQVDPHKHEVLQTGPGELEMITEVFEDGYEYQGKILRPAKVKAGDGKIETMEN